MGPYPTTQLSFYILVCLRSKHVRLGNAFLRWTGHITLPPSPTNPYRIHTPTTKLTFCQLLCLNPNMWDLVNASLEWTGHITLPPSPTHPYMVHTPAIMLTFCQLLCLRSKYVRFSECFLRMDRSYYPPPNTHTHTHTPPPLSIYPYPAATKLTFCQLLCLRSKHVRLGECFLRMDRSSLVLVRSFQLRSKVFSFDIPCNMQIKLTYVRILTTLTDPILYKKYTHTFACFN